jgi:hypothetical protein
VWPCQPTSFGKPTLTDSKLTIPPLLSLGSRSGSHERLPHADPADAAGRRSGVGPRHH